MDFSSFLTPQFEDGLSTFFNDISINFNSLITSFGPFVMWVLSIIGFWLCLNKLGDKGWKSIIPIYSTYTMFKHAFKSVIWFILFLIGKIIVILSLGMFIASIILLVFAYDSGYGDGFQGSSFFILILSLIGLFVIGLFVNILKKVAIFKFMAKLDNSYICSIIGIFLPKLVMFFMGVVTFDFNKINEKRKSQYDSNGYIKMEDENSDYNYNDYYGGDNNEE